ncbi:MAG: hypothetical protein IJZ16_00025 [Clostridia bacterium]|nr:hypothetical protein [Clostridia bacterium]
MFNKKTKLKLTDFECNLLINGIAICFSQTASPQKMLTNCSLKSSINLKGSG